MNSTAVLFPPVGRVTRSDVMTALVYGAGCLLGGLVSALALLWTASGFVAPVPQTIRHLLFLAALGYVFVARALAMPLPVPETRQQISAEVLLAGGRPGAFRFGFEIGTGVRTYLPTGAPHVLAAYLLLGAPPAALALVAGSAFGAGRVVQPLATAFIRSRDSFQEGGQAPVRYVARPSTLLSAVGVALLRYS